MKVVSPHEMNLEAGKISLKSPIGAALMGRKAGEIVEAQVPSGTLRLKIESITSESEPQRETRLDDEAVPGAVVVAERDAEG